MLPTIEVNWPVAAIVIVVFAVIGLVLRAILHSRLVLVIAIVAGIVLAAPQLSGAVTAVVNALVTLAVVLVIGVGVLAYLMHVSPDVAQMARELMALLPRKDRSVPPAVAPCQPPIVIDQPPTPTAIQPQQTRRQVRRVRSGADSEWW